MTLDLWDYRRRVADSYARVRSGGAGEDVWNQWRRDRDLLFATHPQTPVEDPTSFTSLRYYHYSPDWRTVGRFIPADGEPRTIGHSGDGTTGFVFVGTVSFDVAGHIASLDVLWLDAYGGGIFVPFGDATNGHETYGGGRYLLDTAKGADLGHEDDLMVLDFNYAYHPSCVYSDRWSCPLTPPGNRLAFRVTAGERFGAVPEAT